MVLWGHGFPFLLAVYLGMELLAHLVMLFNLWRTARLFSNAAAFYMMMF